MQLNPAPRRSALRRKLGAAACVLLASSLPAAAKAEGGGSTQLDTSILFYGETARAKVTEPAVRITRLFADGQSVSAQLVLDAITGASPTGAVPSGIATTTVQTTTTPSGNVVSTSSTQEGQIPLASFRDTRVALNADWTKPIGLATTALGGHVSRERDYRSLGGTAKLSVDVLRRLATITVGGGYNHDQVDPVGGTPVGLSEARVIYTTEPLPKDVATALFGVSRVLTRRWLFGVSLSRSREQGYLTEPYKVLSILDPATGVTTGQVTEKRPSTRIRSDILASSVYHLSRDVLYTSYRYYRDDWGVRSHTIDGKYRHEESPEVYLEPHLRFYTQTGATFYHTALLAGEPLPEYATADYRVGALETATVGLTLGYHPEGSPGQWTVRAEYIGQFGTAHPSDVVGVQDEYDLFPPLNIATLVVGYTTNF
jgi:hypothetical protein